MNIPKRNLNESLPEYADRLSEIYSSNYASNLRKEKGQIFTPIKISSFMADLFDSFENQVNILDPGAGTGILIADVCEKLLTENKKFSLTIDAYENDPNLLPYLTKTLNECKKELEKQNFDIRYNIYNEDFILSNEAYFNKYKNPGRQYDIVISNPPYFKLRKDSPQSNAMNEIIYGQPNIYALFMAMATSLTKPTGKLVFIIPRSFCSGLYYKKFRKWFLDQISIESIHIFESRKEIFEKDQILQENIILKGKKNGQEKNQVKISVSKNTNFNNMSIFKTKYSNIVYSKNGEIFIRIPSSIAESKLIEIVDNWPKILKDLNLKISTGPVVPFRSKQILIDEIIEKTSVPLLWMHNIQNMKVVWPRKKNKKESAIISTKRSQKILTPVKNYILINRFSSKEQNRRLYSGVLLKSDFPYEFVGIENHLNYIYRPDGELTEFEAFGIAALLNTRLVDKFFRSINGNTQVNATEIRVLPLPDMETIKEIGKKVLSDDEIDLDKLVIETIGISKFINFKNINILKALEVE